MPALPNPLRTLALSAAAAATLGLTACGGGDDKPAPRAQTTTTQKPSPSLRERAERIVDDVKSGKLGLDDARRELEALAKKVSGTAGDAASDALHRLKDSGSGLSDEAKKRFEEAKKALGGLG